MKKILIYGAVALVLIIVAVVIGVAFFLDSGLKKGVETVGPMVLGVPVKVESVKLSFASGSGSIKGLVVGNPPGFKAPSAINLGYASLALDPGSVLSDKIIVRSIEIKEPVVTFETDLKGNNLSKIMANMEDTSGGDQPAEQTSEEASRKLQVDSVLLTGGKINVAVTALGGKSMTVPLPEISLKNLGAGPEGITAAELTRVLLKEISNKAIPAATAAVGDLTKQAVGAVGDLGQGSVDAVNKAAGGLGGLFKKKPAATNAPAK